MPDPSKGVGRLLVVDDLAPNRRLLRRRMERYGFTVETAEGGQECLDRVALGGVDLVLLDVMMPGMSGIDVVRRLRVHHRLHELPVIMVTALDQSSTAVEALEQGANDYVTKPVDYPVLLARVRTQLRVKRLSDLKDEFFRIATHDLRNPLTKIMGGADVVLSLCEPGEPLIPEVHRLLGGIMRGAEEMQTIIEDFLEFGAVEEESFRIQARPVDLAPLLQRVVESARGTADAKGIALELEAGGDLTAEADADRIRQVVNNLVSNALKFSHSGTTVSVKSLARPDSVLVEVSDRGPGFSAEDVERAFEPYARLSAKPTGGEPSTGLGLSICRRIVDLHGGQIGVRNHDDGPGATIWFELRSDRA
jgi:two-component system, sensor histidine kinase and response regulator